MRTAIAFYCILFIAGAYCSAQQTGLAYPCHRLAQAPTVDGDVTGDAAWECTPAATGFYVLGGGYTKLKQTTFSMGFDAEALYLAAVCEEPDAAQLAPAVADGGWTWSEDSIELFLQPAGQSQVYQLGLTAGGAMGSGNGNPDISLCRAAARIAEQEYSVEMRIPFSVFGVSAPAAGDLWHGTVCRNVMTDSSGGDKFTCWSPLRSRFLEPESFAAITMHAEPLTPSQALELTAGLNASYRQTVLAELAAAAAEGEGYIVDLRAAAGDAEFGERARALIAQWQQIGQINAEAATADIRDVRGALTGVRQLALESYELKFHQLLTELVRE